MLMLLDSVSYVKLFVRRNIKWEICSLHGLLTLYHMLLSWMNEVFVNCVDVTDTCMAFMKLCINIVKDKAEIFHIRYVRFHEVFRVCQRPGYDLLGSYVNRLIAEFGNQNLKWFILLDLFWLQLNTLRLCKTASEDPRGSLYSSGMLLCPIFGLQFWDELVFSSWVLMMHDFFACRALVLPKAIMLYSVSMIVQWWACLDRHPFRRPLILVLWPPRGRPNNQNQAWKILLVSRWRERWLALY